MDSPLKEEKIEIKKGLLEKSSGEEKRLFKSWKGRYFVFCQIRRGDTIWLKLYYYRSFSSYKEGSLPKGLIDITTASHIGMVDREIDGHGHIIRIATPGRTYLLSASSCDEMSFWLLALRAYKYNDESRLPMLQRAHTWNGPEGASRRPNSMADTNVGNPQETRRISDSVVDAYMGAFASNRKLRNKFLVCDKCKGRYTAPEVSQWVPPEHSDIYNTDFKNVSNTEVIYEEPRFDDPPSTSPVNQRFPTETDDYMNVRKPLPLPPPPGDLATEGSISSSDNYSINSGGQVVKRDNVAVDGPDLRPRLPPVRVSLAFDTNANIIQVSSDDEFPTKSNDLTSPSSQSLKCGVYVMMHGNKPVETGDQKAPESELPRLGSLSKTTSVPYNLDGIRPSDSFGLARSTESLPPRYDETLAGAMSFLSSSEGRPSQKMDYHGSPQDDRYISEPVANGSTPSRKGSRDNRKKRTKATSLTREESPQNQTSDGLEDSGSRPSEQNARGSRLEMLKRKYGMTENLFVTDV